MGGKTWGPMLAVVAALSMWKQIGVCSGLE